MTSADASEVCFSCGARVPRLQGPVHRYMASSPGCWAVYGEVLTREYGGGAAMEKHRLTVDAYAVQHPGVPGPQATRSVCLHLCSLCAVLERGLAPSKATGLLRRLATQDDWPWLAPPATLGPLTVADVRRAEGLEEHLAAVERWARAAWEGWAPHHEQVRGWVDRWCR